MAKKKAKIKKIMLRKNPGKIKIIKKNKEAKILKIQSKSQKKQAIKNDSFSRKLPEFNAVKTFQIKTLQILDESGNCDEKLMPKVSNEEIKKFFELMILARISDQRHLSLQRQGRLGTYASTLGQEATQIGYALAMQDTDWMFPSFRANAALIARKIPITNILQYWAGDERGHKWPEGVNNCPIVISVATQLPHAVGAAWGAKIRGDKIAVLVDFGDGGTSKGDFHEAMNFAGTFKLPVVFVCQNNQWAISVPRSVQTAAETIAQKAIAYGFEGMLVDGNDVFAVYKTVKEALEKARNGGGPTLIECYTYRISDHTTADDATRYRDPKEVEFWKKRDPLDRLRKYMQDKKLWTKEYEESITKEFEAAVEKAVQAFESIPAPDPKDIFSYTYSEINQNLQEQMKELTGSKKNEEEQKKSEKGE